MPCERPVGSVNVDVIDHIFNSKFNVTVKYHQLFHRELCTQACTSVKLALLKLYTEKHELAKSEPTTCGRFWDQDGARDGRVPLVLGALIRLRVHWCSSEFVVATL